MELFGVIANPTPRNSWTCSALARPKWNSKGSFEEAKEWPDPACWVGRETRCACGATTVSAWIKRYILSHGKRHPDEMGAEEVSAFLSHLAREKNVAASTQNQALAAILFLYKQVLHQELP